MSTNSEISNEQSVLLTFFRHHLWANLRLFDSCLTLSGDQLMHADPGTFGTIRATLFHLVRAEEWYLFLLTGEETAGPELDSQTPLAGMKERAYESGTMLMQLSMDIDPSVEVAVGEGEERELIPVTIILLQAIHHAHEHRTQIATLMGQQGITPPSLSGWGYFEEEISPQQK